MTESWGASQITFADSAASRHFFADRRDFITYSEPNNGDRTGVAAKGTFKIVGRGRVQKWVEYEEEKIEVIFEDALHAPDLDHDLVSIGSLVRKGVKLGIDATGATLRAPDGRPFMKCPMSGTMFIVNFTAPPRPPAALAT